MNTTNRVLIALMSVMVIFGALTIVEDSVDADAPMIEDIVVWEGQYQYLTVTFSDEIETTHLLAIYEGDVTLDEIVKDGLKHAYKVTALGFKQPSTSATAGFPLGTLKVVPGEESQDIGYTIYIKGSSVTETSHVSVSEDTAFTVTFDSDGGEPAVTQEKVKINETAVEPVAPTKKSTETVSYTFDAWYTADGEKYDFATPVTSDLTLTAKWIESPLTVKVTITWNNDDGTLIDTTQVELGEVPTHSIPVKEPTAQYTYEFKEWTPEIVAAFEDATYTAVYNELVNIYNVKFCNYDGYILQNSEYAYGSMPEYLGETPVKPSAGGVDYVFVGWDPAIAAVTGDATYTAVFADSTATYEIVFEAMNEIISTQEVKAGDMPAVPEAPLYEGFEFVEWDPAVVPAAADARYVAVYEAIVTYTINFVNYDGTVLQTSELEAGAVPAYTGETPVKPSAGGVDYVFVGWDPAIVAVTEDATYTAVFAESTVTYKITFIAQNEVISEQEVKAGDMPAVPEAPLVEGYVFKEWNPAVVPAVADATYTAVYEVVTVTFTIKFVNYDGTVLQTSELEAGAMPAYTGEVPTRADDDQYRYTFDGWNPEIVAVTADAVYTAQYSQEEFAEEFYVSLSQDGTAIRAIVDCDEGILKSGKLGIQYTYVVSKTIAGKVRNVVYTSDVKEYDENGGTDSIIEVCDLADEPNYSTISSVWATYTVAYSTHVVTERSSTILYEHTEQLA